jgi:hypothetical protein
MHKVGLWPLLANDELIGDLSFSELVAEALKKAELLFRHPESPNLTKRHKVAEY